MLCITHSCTGLPPGPCNHLRQRTMTTPLALTSTPAVGCAAACLHARRLSSQAATCSYAAPQHRKRVRDSTACRAAQTEVVEEPEAGEDEELLSGDLLKLLGPRTVPTPVLSPAEVSASITVLPPALESYIMTLLLTLLLQFCLCHAGA